MKAHRKSVRLNDNEEKQYNKFKKDMGYTQDADLLHACLVSVGAIKATK